MTLQEVLDTIQLKYPHAYTNAQIIMMLNDIQRRIFRTIFKRETADTMDIIANNPFYPITFSPDNIIEVVVNGEEYPSQNIKYDSQGRYHYIADDNFIGIVPTPKENVYRGLTIFHYKEPSELSADDLEAVPDLEKAWHELLVYRCCVELAEIARDGEMVNAFTVSINNIEQDFKRSKRAKPHRIQDVYVIGRNVQ